jgi:hypothetical protein
MDGNHVDHKSADEEVAGYDKEDEDYTDPVNYDADNEDLFVREATVSDHDDDVDSVVDAGVVGVAAVLLILLG